MEFGEWRSLFAGQILSRGIVYWEQGRVGPVRREGAWWCAEVRGSERYQVRLLLQGGRIEQMTCTCPYAAQGFSCKHMAALCLALESENLSRAVESLSHEEAKEILLTLARQNSDLSRFLLTRWAQMQTNAPEDAGVFCQLCEKFERVAEAGLAEEDRAWYRTRWEALAARAESGLQWDMFRWFRARQQEERGDPELRAWLLELQLRLFDNDVMRRSSLQMLDALISRAEGEGRRPEDVLIRGRLSLMQSLGAPESVLDAYRARHAPPGEK